jgi:RNA polymerase sigma-70 factor (ECF subfamily)
MCYFVVACMRRIWKAQEDAVIDLSGAGDFVAAAWRADRAYLIDLAYRMLGDIGAAEDVVQEAFLRLDMVEPGAVRDPRGWLTVVTSRLCLDRIRSAQNRREHPSDTAWLDSALSASQQTVVDPADRVTLDEEVSEALLILLQRLSPAERVSFVLQDVFQLPFDQIAEILGKPTATCRQLAKRARAKVAGGPDTTKREMADQQQLAKLSQTFLAASANGNLEALTALLHDDVWGIADFTAGEPPQLRPRRRSQQVQRGADRIARTLLRFFGGNVTLVSAPAVSGLAFLAYLQRRPYATITASVEGGLLTSMHVVVNLDALRAANLTVADLEAIGLASSAGPDGR